VGQNGSRPVIRSPDTSTAEARIDELSWRAARYAGEARLEPSSLSHLPAGELTRLVDGLENTARPCGCKEGAVGVSLAFVLWPVWVVLRRRPSTVVGWVVRILELIPVTVLAALAFKGAGIARGRVRHRRLLGALAAAARRGDAPASPGRG
jgi:hypothetical protein